MTEKIISRIRKMLELANNLGATEGEREAALHQAYRTMAHYNMDMATIQQSSEEPRGAYDFAGFSFPFAKTICNSVADLFFCFYITGQKINGTQCTHNFIGKESNAATAMVMSDWIIKSVMKEGRKLYKQNTSPECRSFCVGAANKLYHRIQEMKAEATSATSSEYTGGTALVLASLYDTERDANEKRALALFDFKTTKSRESKVKADAYERGKKFGATINLSLQVGKTSPKELK